MTSELKAAAEKRVREIAYATGWSGDMRVNMTTVVGALRCAVKMLDEERAARLAADAQQYEYIATLERERDEARAAYCEAKVERDEARAAYCALRDDVQRLYVAGNCETHSEDDWWWCDALAGINGKKGIMGTHPDRPEWRKGGDE